MPLPPAADRVSPAPHALPGGGVRVMPIPRLAAGGRWRVEAMRSLSEPLLLWFTRGQGRITMGGITRGYSVHNAIFIPAGTMHGFEVGPQVHGTALFFGRSPGVPLPAEALHLRVREAALQFEINAQLDALARELESGMAGHDRAAACHLGLVSVWIERQAAAAGDDRAPRPDAARRLAGRFATLLEREFRSGLGVADYAAALGVTPTHLTRACKQACARSASALLQDRVLFEARRLLAETRLPVKSISQQLGFTSAAYFTRAFQTRTGLTPTAFRRNG
ncbi:MAG: AraC family transcriptional regulator [Rhodobacteraceae bacterium]|jgi:AraC-like DNA-binding protein|nr:AraC family transcriptional regulator [Paracoccaceae bacterium]